LSIVPLEQVSLVLLSYLKRQSCFFFEQNVAQTLLKIPLNSFFNKRHLDSSRLNEDQEFAGADLTVHQVNAYPGVNLK